MMRTATKSDFVSRMEAAAAMSNGFPTAIVNGLSRHVDARRLRVHFELDGGVIDVDLCKDSAIGRSMGSAFVTFASPEVLSSVLLQGDHFIDGDRIDIKAYDKLSGGGSLTPAPRASPPRLSPSQPTLL